MTGYGAADWTAERSTVTVEVRSVNNRYLKVALRANEPYHLLEPEVEKVVRRVVKRGTVQVSLRVQRQFLATDFALNTFALRSYLQQVGAVGAELGLRDAALHALGAVLALPGVAPEPGGAAATVGGDWAVIEPVLEQALQRMHAMRQDEGARMAAELLQQRQKLCAHLDQLQIHLPGVAATYRNRLLDRVNALLAPTGTTLTPTDIIREVALYADRVEVNEEVVRLTSHLEQFATVVQTETDNPGRKLEFVTQEMGRETNTIGAKAADATVSRVVVEMKAGLEKIRELIQNIE
jgi:uncharacterized protein (TIGR00255 family)